MEMIVIRGLIDGGEISVHLLPSCADAEPLTRRGSFAELVSVSFSHFANGRCRDALFVRCISEAIVVVRRRSSEVHSRAKVWTLFPCSPTVVLGAEILGFDGYIPPFANTSVSDIMKGVNYASAASGILNETGTHWGEHFSLKMQVENHKAIVSKITMKLRNSDKAKEHLNKCLYYVSIGSNDYINNYFLPEHYNSSQTFSTDQFAKALVKEYSRNLMELRSLGARKFALIGLLPIGCIPGEISARGKPGSLCVKEENDAVVTFNDELKSLVDRFNKEFPDSKFIFIDTVKAILTGTTKNVQDVKAGLVDVVSCCKVGSNGLCIPNEKPCKNRNVRPFFDSYHPSDFANEANTAIAYNDVSTKAAYPMDISHLVKL
ncbi:GDSL esterase/lipase [Vigna angularis]|uniref:GDSL esterase/lipase n=1 Tax=Phaseolus angularis TaxID=3914 RepID=A0A8T0LIC9_PHAAN|nr:GDSL esterase/lipase [Vigna angularis]